MFKKYDKISSTENSLYIRVINDLRVLAGKERLLGSYARRYLIKLILCGIALTFLPTYAILSAAKCGNVFSGDPLTLAYSLISSVIIGTLWPPAWYYIKARSRGRNVERELKYFIISEGISTTNATELISDLVSTSEWPQLFPALSKESVKFLKLRKFMALFDTIKYYSKWIFSRNVSRCLSDYLHSLSLGTALEWLQDKTDELINELRSSTQATIKLRTMVSLVLAIVLGYIPPLMTALSILVGEGIVIKALILTLLITPLSMVLTPQLPLHARISSRIQSVKTAIISIVAVSSATIAAVFFSHITYSRVNYVLAASACLIVWGIIKTYHYAEGVIEAMELPRILARVSEAPLVVSNPCRLVSEILASSRVRSFREVGSNFKLDKASKIINELKLWTSRFVLYVIIKAISNGSLTRERTLKLRELVLDFTRDIKSLLATNTVIIMMAALLPYMISTISGFATHTTLVSTYSVVASIMFSLYASYIVFDDLTNTLLPGITLLTLLLMGGLA
ncbi:MAG: hypothetical protein J7L12_00080 [Desulfurococcales archaeon]|nr:hypothetical protein [Desulfurococcales archaeon]